MYARSIFAVGALVAVVAAVPMAGGQQRQQKRELVMVTHTDVVMETVQATVTVWVDPSAPTPAAAANNNNNNNLPNHYGHGHGHSHNGGHPHGTTTIPSTSTAPYVAPSSPESTYQAPTSTYVPPPTSSTYVAPTTTTTPAAAPSYAAPSSSAAPSPTGYSGGGGGSSGAPSGGTNNGWITYYAPGLGSCGWTNSDSDMIVAVNANVLGNGGQCAGKCGHYITVEYGGVSQVAKITDLCPACGANDLDMTSSLFQKFAGLDEGKVQDVKWYFNDMSPASC